MKKWILFFLLISLPTPFYADERPACRNPGFSGPGETSSQLGSSFLTVGETPALQAAVLQKTSQDGQKKYTLSICGIFRNEARYLKEWIEYHRLVGVDHFYLYNNKSIDYYKRALEPYIQAGIVTFMNWPDCLTEWEESPDRDNWALSTQVPAYEHAIKLKASLESKWLVFVDIDEFLVPFEKATLAEQLLPYDEYAAVTLSRVYYDASKIDTIPRRRLVIESTELTRGEDNPQKSVSKTIFKPDRAVGFTWPPYRPRFATASDKEIELKSHDIRVNRYTNRYRQGYLHYGKPKDRLDVDNRTVHMSHLSAALEEGYEIEDQERLIFRFIPDVLKRLGYN